MRIDIRPAAGSRYKRALAGLSKEQLAQANAEAINMGAGRLKNAMRDEMRSVFDRPTRFIQQSVQVHKRATASDLNAMVAPTYMGGKGGEVDPQQVLAGQELGGRRLDKRSEKALRRVGILPAGYQTAIPSDRDGGPFPGSDDGHGNLKGSFLIQLISYFQAFGEQGYRANMGAQGYKRIHKNGRKKDMPMRAKGWTAQVRGHRFFVAYGKDRGGPRMTRKGEPDTRTSHLRPGIWAARGTGGVDLRPVLLFVRNGDYKPRISLDAVRQRSGVDELVPRWIRGRVYDAFRRAGG